MRWKKSPPKKQIVSSRSFGQPVHALPDLSEAVASHTSYAAEKLGAQAGVCNAIQVFIHTNPFREQDPQYSNSLVIPLPNASSDTRILVRAALFGLKKIYRMGYAYKKAGVTLMGLSEAQMAQGSFLLEHGSGERSERLMMAMDALNRRYGRNTISVFFLVGSQALGHAPGCYVTLLHYPLERRACCLCTLALTARSLLEQMY